MATKANKLISSRSLTGGLKEIKVLLSSGRIIKRLLTRSQFNAVFGS